MDLSFISLIFHLVCVCKNEWVCLCHIQFYSSFIPFGCVLYSNRLQRPRIFQATPSRYYEEQSSSISERFEWQIYPFRKLWPLKWIFSAAQFLVWVDCAQYSGKILELRHSARIGNWNFFLCIHFYSPIRGVNGIFLLLIWFLPHIAWVFAHFVGACNFLWFCTRLRVKKQRRIVSLGAIIFQRTDK